MSSVAIIASYEHVLAMAAVMDTPSSVRTVTQLSTT